MTYRAKFKVGQRIQFRSYCYHSQTQKFSPCQVTAVIYEVGYSSRFSRFFYWCNQHQVLPGSKPEITSYLEVEQNSFVWQSPKIELINWNNMETKLEQYNFSDLTPEVQRFIYKRLYAFDLACCSIAEINDEHAISMNTAMSVRVYKSLETDDRLIVCNLQELALEEKLPRDCFNNLTPAARWATLFWDRAIKSAAAELWSLESPNKTEDQVLNQLLSNTESAMADHTPEEIACYWGSIDREPLVNGGFALSLYETLLGGDA